jgi:diguanylate cyclase (GGDEF)-like protein/PAS domain S-box-containing protein
VLDFEQPEIFRNVLESLQTGVYFVDRDQKILFWNEGAEKITGYLRHEVVGSFCRENLIARGDGSRNVLSDAAEALTSVLRDGKPTMAEVSLRHKAGHRIFVRLRAVPIRNGHGTIIGAAESFEESLSSSDWDRRQSKLLDYGCLDPVTGVLTQGVILTHLRENLVTFFEHLMPFSILRVEVDGMDRLRASYGLAVVTPVLRVAAQTMENSLRPTDFLGRLGDNQFLAILTECGLSEIRKTADRVRKMVNSSEVEWWGDRWTVTASFGATTVKAGDSPESILERTESALGESLAAGGNCVTVNAMGEPVENPSKD